MPAALPIRTLTSLSQFPVVDMSESCYIMSDVLSNLLSHC